MASALGGDCQQTKHTAIPGVGAPQRWQMGGITRGSLEAQAAHNHVPTVPQPAQRRGSIKSRSASAHFLQPVSCSMSANASSGNRVPPSVKRPACLQSVSR